jgi:uncharacterized protein
MQMVTETQVDSQRQENLTHWRRERKLLEEKKFGRISQKDKVRGRFTAIDRVLPHFKNLLKLGGVYGKGQANALNIALRQLDLSFPNLPSAFDGYKILHLTDMHLESFPGIENRIAGVVKEVEHDLTVITGDYRLNPFNPPEMVYEPMQVIINALQPVDGILATLGNHELHHDAEYVAQLGARMLINETVSLHRGNESFHITGLDDPHYYATTQMDEALFASPDKGFKLALVHSPEYYEEAAAANYDLYLCGHTHGGQIRLPGGIPLVKHLYKGQHLYKGLWQHGQMIGYTSAGCGVSGIPVRFFCQGEVTLITLRRH